MTGDSQCAERKQKQKKKMAFSQNRSKDCFHKQMPSIRGVVLPRFVVFIIEECFCYGVLNINIWQDFLGI